jgi:Mn2+/Fe2+ NRAMP family transporter
MFTKKFLKTLGPGILFATTAIGVSHLVQSTRAGAEYGFALIGFALMANILKYPFFEFGSRYANATGKSLIYGYNKMGKGMLILYLGITLVSMFTVTAAVTYVCVGLMINLFQLPLDPSEASILLMAICMTILLSGKFSLLDSLIKLIGAVLLISTLIAFVMTLWHGPVVTWEQLVLPLELDKSNVFFIIALMGWMPTAVDLSTWNSIWTLERIKQTDYLPTLKETLKEFNIGYWITAGLSICFITLGAFLIYGSGTELSNSSAGFANQVVGMFTTALGKGAYYFIAISAFSVMFSTCITVYDGYSRAMSETTALLLDASRKEIKTYKLWLIIVLVGGFIVINNFLGNFKELVDLATIISFVIAPLIAIVNFKLVLSDDLTPEEKPNLLMRVLSVLGIVYLLGFSLLFVALKLEWINL